MSKSKLIKARKVEKGANIAKRIHLVKMIEYDGRSIRHDAKDLCMTLSWGVKWQTIQDRWAKGPVGQVAV